MNKLFVVTSSTNRTSISKQLNTNFTDSLSNGKRMKIHEQIMSIKHNKINMMDKIYKYDTLGKELQELISYNLKKLGLRNGVEYDYIVEDDIGVEKEIGYEIRKPYRKNEQFASWGLNSYSASIFYCHNVGDEKARLEFYPTRKGHYPVLKWINNKIGTKMANFMGKINPKPDTKAPIDVPIEKGTMVSFTSQYIKPIIITDKQKLKKGEFPYDAIMIYALDRRKMIHNNDSVRVYYN